MGSMKHSTFFTILFVVVLLSCTKQNPTPTSTSYMNTITFTGYDARKCMCCGGLIGNFRGDTTSRIVPDSLSFLVVNQSDELGIDNRDMRFPFSLNVDWEEQSACAGRRIKITKVYR
jgi:hypothetical protein